MPPTYGGSIPDDERPEFAQLLKKLLGGIRVQIDASNVELSEFLMNWSFVYPFFAGILLLLAHDFA